MLRLIISGVGATASDVGGMSDVFRGQRLTEQRRSSDGICRRSEVGRHNVRRYTEEDVASTSGAAPSLQ